MTFNRTILLRAALLISLMVNLTILSSKIQADTESCGGVTVTLPFTDVMGNFFFCQIAEAYFSGLTNGTSATTFSPASNVTREQMAAFTTRTLDQSLKRGSRRAALNQWWTSQGPDILGTTTVGEFPFSVISDGADLWVANLDSATVSRVRASDGKLLETWTDAPAANGVLVALGKVFVTGRTNPGRLYQIDPTQTAGAVTTLSSSLGISPKGIAFDGQRIWTANGGNANGGGSVSILTLNPLTITTITIGFSLPAGILYDGANIWVTDVGDGKLKRLATNGDIIQSIDVVGNPGNLTFDGTNLWVPISVTNTVVVVRASTGVVLATLSGNGLNNPFTAAFDGERILVTNINGGNSVSLWKASDLTPLGTFSVGAQAIPYGACSDGLNFWVTLDVGIQPVGKLMRF